MENFLNELTICNIPDQNSFVYKDECVYCFNTLESQEGLYICMKTFIGVCKDHLKLFFQKSKNHLFLNLRIEKRVKITKSEALSDDSESEYKKLLKEAFHNKFETKESQYLFFMPTKERIILPADLPSHIEKSVKNILSADCIAKASERGQKSEKWEDSYIVQSKHAKTLLQLDNNVKIPPSGWKCSQCDLTTNLWLNLTDGAILCGRKFFDGSGGNNHAIDHYKKTLYPLAVKLGTITPERADVFSYDEDIMVIDPFLAEHLAHFGIDIMKMTKTDKSVEEIEMDNIKRNREQIAIMESESNLEQLTGAGFTGIVNTGNSCYINSVVQVLFKIPAFSTFYSDRYEQFMLADSVTNGVKDFRIQMSKLGYYLQKDNYSYPIKPVTENDGEIIHPAPGITPQLFRAVIGQNHADFSTKQQQDAFEFLIHLMGLVQKDVIKHKDEIARNPLQSMNFRIEDRVFCETSQTVKYQSREESVLSLPIYLEDATNMDKVKVFESENVDQVLLDNAEKPLIKFESCLNRFTSDDIIIDYIVNGRTGRAFHSSKLETFPDYLWVQMKRFTVGADWMPKKLDVEIDVPDNIDLSFMRATGIQPNEVAMVDDDNNHDNKAASPPIELNMDYVDQLRNMGFPINACKNAVFHTHGASSVEDAANWLMIHIGEPDFEQLSPELLAATNPATNDATMADENDVKMLMSMGFSRPQAIRALLETDSLERAADWACNHLDELDQMVTDEPKDNKALATSLSDGEPKYTLVALISHMGNNTHVGHYVCHIKLPDDSWALFNDDKVQRSINPPKKLAYLYLYKRVSTADAH